MAGLDGIRREILPEKHGFGPVDRNIYEMSECEKREIKSVPGSLDDALSRAGDATTSSCWRAMSLPPTSWRSTSRSSATQAAEVRLRPVPLEFALYYDA